MEGYKILSGSKEYHRSVFLKEVIEALRVAPDKWYLDATLGDGGHTVEILRRGGRVVGVDVDPQALHRAEKRFKELGFDQRKFRLIQGNFRDIKNLLIQQTDTKDLKFASSIFDLGVSSLQLENPERGFSFSKTGPLDMRMDPNLQVRALDLINVLSRKELYELFKNLGEEKYSRSLADALVSAREVITTTDLTKIVEKTIGGRRGKIHPATRIFQALRIAVNDELEAFKEGLVQVIDLIEKGGHILVISFHSLEDRITKLTFREWENKGLGKAIFKRPVTPSAEEIRDNSRSRSAKMRVFVNL